MFFGDFDHALDAQGRITIPKEWRQPGGENDFVLFAGGCYSLLLFPLETFKEFFAKTRDESLLNPRLQLALSRFGASARQCRCDKQGRIALDRKLVERVGVCGKFKLLGAVTHIRLCPLDKWSEPNPDENCAAMDEIRSQSGGGIPGALEQLVGIEK